MADDTTTQAKNLILNFISHVHNHQFTEASNYFHDSLTIIKPDGTLINKNGWIKMVNGTEISVVSNELLLWNFFELSDNNNLIFCGYTTKFTYHINSENKTITEKAIFTALLKKSDDQLKIHYLQRTGAMTDP